jgi:type 1 glutamine amidotransferase
MTSNFMKAEIEAANPPRGKSKTKRRLSCLTSACYSTAMQPLRPRTTLPTLITALLLASSFRTSAASPTPPNDEELRKLEHAIPPACTAKPAQPRQLLVFTRCRGYVHASIPYGATMIGLMGRKTGAFTAVVSDDPATLAPESLKRFDAVCLMSALGEFFLPEDFNKLPADRQNAIRVKDRELKDAFYAWIRSGKGLAAIHGGCYAFNESPAFAELFGGAFDSHPWNSYERIVVRLDEPDHVLNAAFHGCGLELIDEGYMFKGPYDRRKLRVLYSLDSTRVDLDKPNLRPDHDFGLGWVKRHGQGRIFFSALGHNNEEYWHPTLVRHWLDGLQFALGDLPAPADPKP